jgi:hypothetical protein
VNSATVPIHDAAVDLQLLIGSQFFASADNIAFSLECIQETDNDGQVRYTCVRAESDADTSISLVGARNYLLCGVKSFVRLHILLVSNIETIVVLYA